MGERIVPEPDHHVGPAGHSRMRSMLTKEELNKYSDRESLEMRLLAWQLLMSNATKAEQEQDRETFKRIEGIIDEAMNDKQNPKPYPTLSFLNQYKQIYETSTWDSSKVSEFRELDLNGDWIITPQEWSGKSD